MKNWEEDFRSEFKKLGELRSIIPRRVDIMALTATATTGLRAANFKHKTSNNS